MCSPPLHSKKEYNGGEQVFVDCAINKIMKKMKKILNHHSHTQAAAMESGFSGHVEVQSHKEMTIKIEVEEAAQPAAYVEIEVDVNFVKEDPKLDELVKTEPGLSEKDDEVENGWQELATAEKRKRGHNFTLDDKDKLINLICDYNDPILNKRTNGTTNRAKNNAWDSLTNKFNSSGSNYRTKESLMKLWEKLKSEAKLYGSSMKKSTSGTGGGPSTVKPDPILSQVCDILGRGCTGIKNVHDSDADLFDLPTITSTGTIPEDAAPYFLQIQENEQQKENDKKEDSLATPTVTEATPIIEYTSPWPIGRQPKLTNSNERSEAVASLCSGFKDNKKLDIEIMKKTLLEEEIQFKRKLYDLQLQAAVKEVEIKQEILLQIKGGSLSLHNLFGFPKKD